LEVIFLYNSSAARKDSLKKGEIRAMSSKKWFLWPLPFGEECDPRCEDKLHNLYCFVFPVVAVILGLSLIVFLREVFTFEFLKRYSLDYQSCMKSSLVVFMAFFGATWKYQKKITIFFWCRRCSGPKEKLESRYGFP